jgi:glycosyltransferase involved in cell wall biosynthesis
MRILHVNNEKTWRGGERQTLITAQEQRKRGVDSWIACREESPLQEYARKNEVPVVPLPVSALGALMKLAGVAKQFDLLHCHTGRAHSLGILAVLAKSRPLVISRRVDFLSSNNWFSRFKYRRADRTVCVSRFIAEHLRNWGVPHDRLRIIYEAVPDEGFLPGEESREELRRKTGLPLDSKIVGNIAALAPHKDQATLLRAAAIVARERNDVTFLVIGEGELRDDLLQLRAGLKLEPVLCFTGFIPQAQRLLKAFDLFAMSSAMEGLGTSVLDANVAGVPVVATAAGGLPEIVNDNETGLLVPVGDSEALARGILRLLDDRALAMRLASSAQERTLREFSPSRMAEKYVEVYQEILKKVPTTTT